MIPLGARWIGARIAGGLAIAVGLLALVAVSWVTRGTDDATRLFQLLQGVILGTLGWLYGSEGVERAEQAARTEGVARRRAESAGETTEERAARLEEDLERANLVLAELSWTDAEQTQAIDRIHRIGQDEPVTAWRIIAAQTIDTKVAELIDSKAGLAARALDGSDEELTSSADVQLEALVTLLTDALEARDPQ